jgi:hypothetical protein
MLQKKILLIDFSNFPSPKKYSLKKRKIVKNSKNSTNNLISVEAAKVPTPIYSASEKKL